MKVVKTKESDNARLYDEKAESDEPSVIYGTDYGEIQSELEGVLLSWGVLVKEEFDS